MKSLYIDMSNSGISGDMFLSSLLGFSTESQNILFELESLKDILNGVTNVKLNIRKVERGGILVSQLKIEISEDKAHRTPKVLKIALKQYLESYKYSNAAKQYAINVLDTLIKAEAKIHGVDIQNIHLHELSSVDTLIDILGVTRILDELGIFEESFIIYCSKIPMGGGTINTAHGLLPVPAPATVSILEGSGLNVQGGPIESELVTPTGAALLVNLNPLYLNFLPEIQISKVSYGTGQKTFDNFQNIIRLFYGELVSELPNLDNYTEDIVILETNIDDVSGEILGNFINLITPDVLDIQVIASITKKNRPSHIIQVYCHPKSSFSLIKRIISELGSLGVRYSITKRVCVDRIIEEREIEIDQKKFKVKFKVSFSKLSGEEEIVNIKPEYEDLRKISNEIGIAIKKVLFFCQQEIAKLLEEYNSKIIKKKNF